MTWDDGGWSQGASQTHLVFHKVKTPSHLQLILSNEHLCRFKSALDNQCSTVLSVGLRKTVVEAHCERLRTLYRDCAKPPPPPSKVDNRVSGG